MPEIEDSAVGSHGVAWREPREFYLTLLDEFPALIWRSDTDGRCDWFNSTWLNFTGRTMAEEVGDGWVQGVHPDDLERCVATWMKNFAVRTPFVMEYRLRHHDGTHRWIRDFGRPFNDTDGSFLGYIGACYDISDLYELTQELAHLASHDPLTGLANRRAFEDAASLANSAARRGTPSTVLFADVDGFKECNDRFGHKRGDRVLREIAEAMRGAVRDIDFVARIGGDEFGILLRDQHPEAVEEVAERLREAVEATGSRHGLNISLSIGAATMDGRSAASEVLARADDRMYDDKRERAQKRG